jgi:mono/diheme cytochrome c family protein
VKIGFHSYVLTVVACALPFIFPASRLAAQDAHFHNAPASSAQLKNPYARQPAAVAVGSRLYTANCGSCHGIKARGTGNIPALSQGPTQSAPDGEVFWFITTGSTDNGMPGWASLPEQKRWQIVTYLKSLKNSSTAQNSDSVSPAVKTVKTNAPLPQAPFTDFRFEQPGTGYEVIRVPLHQTSRASGEYEDFVTGFVVDNGHVWGRPVGITAAHDGSLLVSDDGSNSIWRISYTGADEVSRPR